MGVDVAGWAQSKTIKTKQALRDLEDRSKYPDAENKKGMKVPLPYVDRDKAYKAHVADGEMKERIKKAPVTDVPIAGLHAIQHSVKRHRVKRYLEHPELQPDGKTSKEHGGPTDLPIVVQRKGLRVVFDGHHRTTAAILRGADQVRARFVDLDDKDDGGIKKK